MRISDWSSDLCSSDLDPVFRTKQKAPPPAGFFCFISGMTFRLYNGNSWIFCREILHTTAFPRDNRRFCATGPALALLNHAASQRDRWYVPSRPTKHLRQEDGQSKYTEPKSVRRGKRREVR